jgi:S1-C subfamily serine protease
MQNLKEMGYMTKSQFRSYLISKNILGFTFDIPEIILEIFTNLLIVQKIEINTIHNNEALYKSANIEVVKFYQNENILLNRIFGFEYIIEKYIPSIIKFENIYNDNVSIGNGFIVKIKGKHIVLTNRHVVENFTQLVLKDYNDEVIDYNPKIEISTNSDLAFVEIGMDFTNIKPFIFNKDLKILDEIITIGYPPIPTTKASYALCHKGEINSSVETYWGDNLFIFSAKTNPGNSGSPIIDKNGTIVGIVSEQLEEKDWYKESKLPYYAGIPSKIILEFLNR